MACYIQVTGVNFDVNKHIALSHLNGQAMVRSILEDIHSTANEITPMLTGDLRADVKKTVTGASSRIVGSIKWDRPYSWYQERGYTNGPVKRYTTPGTKAHFAEDSADAAMAKLSEYATRLKV